MLTRKDTRLKHRQAMAVLEERIATGAYVPGNRLPPIKHLAEEMGMNYLTVRKAVHLLADNGVVEVVHGLGTFVGANPGKAQPRTIRIAMAFRNYFFTLVEHHPAVGAYLAGAHGRLKSEGNLIQTLSFGDGRLTEDIGPILVDHETDGVAIVGGGVDEEDVRFLHGNGIHVVSTALVPCDAGMVSVGIDRNRSLDLAVEHLCSLGHGRVAFIVYSESGDRVALEREYARLAFDLRLGDPRELRLVVRNPGGLVHWEDVNALFDLDPRPSAVVVTDEFLADVVLDGCTQRGLDVPGDLSIVTLQDAAPRAHRVPLTTTQDAAGLNRVAYVACDTLLKLIGGQALENKNIVLMPDLKVKASTGGPPRAR